MSKHGISIWTKCWSNSSVLGLPELLIAKPLSWQYCTISTNWVFYTTVFGFLFFVFFFFPPAPKKRTKKKIVMGTWYCAYTGVWRSEPELFTFTTWGPGNEYSCLKSWVISPLPNKHLWQKQVDSQVEGSTVPRNRWRGFCGDRNLVYLLDKHFV